MPLHFNESPNQAFSDWKNGETGQKFIDANMLELKATGYMSNRGRQNVASYLVHHLKENWIHGARWFECQLIDYEVCNNYGNWTYVAGVGHDPRENRVFNPKIQSERYDPESRYINTWNIENQ
jgi:deoxyribodipyrimidine photo-lyase